jgi:catechol 2,3-dioxygenase-like lactoylglutathione lyase family enzyme
MINRTIFFSIAFISTFVFSFFSPISSHAEDKITAVTSIGMTVENMERSIKFYSDVLSFEKISDMEVRGEPYEKLVGIFGVRLRIVKMRIGNEFIELTEYLTPKGKPIPMDSRSNDHWFQHIAIVVGDMDKAYQHLRNHNIKHVSTAPQTIPDWNKAAAGIRAFYFRAPDDHNLEIIFYPPGKSDPKWQQKSDKLFLGIDHTAIVVSNTEKSRGFYQDLLGMKIAGESENYGEEQEHLNNVFGARLRITALKSDQGSAIELLEYLTPRDGRPFPIDVRANDLMHWQTTLTTLNLNNIARQLMVNEVRFVSPEVITLPEDGAGMKKAILVRDPDGHAMRIVEK